MMVQTVQSFRLRLPMAVFIGAATVSLACGSSRGPNELREQALALSVSDLQMHLRADAYRTYAHLDDGGRNAFSVALWRLDRIQEQRSATPGDTSEWTDEDVVIEFARARALERLRRYRDAADAFRGVAVRNGLLAEPAAEHRQIMEIFASIAEVSAAFDANDEHALEAIEAWSHAWSQLAGLMPDPAYASLARLEAELWDEARVDHFMLRGKTSEAIRACQQLIQLHGQSKSYPHHMIRLGDLHAEAARREYIASRAERRPLKVDLYEQALERAFSAYELASEARKPRLRREAQSKIEALLAYHEGVRSDVQ
jgi:tetratricopeptide (TPR) repeat protein